MTFREELAALGETLNLRIVHILEDAPEAWEGETGYIDEAMFRRHLPERFERLQYFVCGPVPMMDAAEDTLDGMGVPDENVHGERFDVV